MEDIKSISSATNIPLHPPPPEKSKNNPEMQDSAVASSISSVYTEGSFVSLLPINAVSELVSSMVAKNPEDDSAMALKPSELSSSATNIPLHPPLEKSKNSPEMQDSPIASSTSSVCTDDSFISFLPINAVPEIVSSMVAENPDDSAMALEPSELSSSATNIPLHPPLEKSKNSPEMQDASFTSSVYAEGSFISLFPRNAVPEIVSSMVAENPEDDAAMALKPSELSSSATNIPLHSPLEKSKNSPEMQDSAIALSSSATNIPLHPPLEKSKNSPEMQDSAIASSTSSVYTEGSFVSLLPRNAIPENPEDDSAMALKSSELSSSATNIPLHPPLEKSKNSPKMQDSAIASSISSIYTEGSVVSEIVSSMVAENPEDDSAMALESSELSSAATVPELLGSATLVIKVSGFKPHAGCNNNAWWETLHQITRHRELSLDDFVVFEPMLGHGDSGVVYLAQLAHDQACYFALKVMDRQRMISRNKAERVEAERSILQMLDHPFLPTLYAHFETPAKVFFLIDYCSGGDLHALRNRHTRGNFSVDRMRFYVAEVLAALEYLHMVGVVYRDLKPENIMIQDDGHIMLSDFDLSLQCQSRAKLIRIENTDEEEEEEKEREKEMKSQSKEEEKESKSQSKARNGLRLNLVSFLGSCVRPKPSLTSCRPSPGHCGTQSLVLCSLTPKKLQSIPLVVAEPLARSKSFVGTYDYLAPEMIGTGTYGSAVDWWAFGVLIYELLYGVPPFSSKNAAETMRKVEREPLSFPYHDSRCSSQKECEARDLIKRLLVKDPVLRLGHSRGASEIKAHPFFSGIDWPLLRSMQPPFLPVPLDSSILKAVPIRDICLRPHPDPDDQKQQTDVGGESHCHS